MSSMQPSRGKKRSRKDQKSKRHKKLRRAEDDNAGGSADDEEDDGDIDWNKLEEALKENAEKANLTTVNVKSILHHILKDKRVIEYAQNIAESDNVVNAPEEPVSESTKMTRSKAKLLGQQPLLAALDKGSSNKPSFLELDFPDDEDDDDEDYNPRVENETDLSQPSDDEEMSLISEATNSLRSPRVLATPLSVNANEVTAPDNNEQNSQDGSCSNEMMMVFKNPKSSTPLVEKKNLIAKRTRSLLPMQDVEVEELEAMFQPPDFEPPTWNLDDLDDEELIWHGWLSDLTKPVKNVLNDTTDDPNDEDFNYMAAAEEETETEEELRDDRATRVTQKELQGLLNELLLGFDEDTAYQSPSHPRYEEVVHEVYEEAPVQPRKGEMRCPTLDLVEATQNLKISFEQRQQITAQLQQHVQLLTQVYMLSCTQQMLREQTVQCKQYVEELAVFHDKAVQNSMEIYGSLNAELSMFCTPGIADSFRIIKSLLGQRIVTKTPKNASKKASNKSLACNCPISDTIAEIFITEPFFATYIELLPKRGALLYDPKEEKQRLRRLKFLDCEDNLLALGLSQFKGSQKFKKITEHLLPTKTAKQLMIRIKNVSYPRSLNNPVAYVKRHKNVPELVNTLNIVVPRDISSLSLYKLPKQVWKNRLIPFWYVKSHKLFTAKEEAEEERRSVEEHQRRNGLFKITAKNNSVGNDIRALPTVSMYPVIQESQISLINTSCTLPFPSGPLSNSTATTTATVDSMVSVQNQNADIIDFLTPKTNVDKFSVDSLDVYTAPPESGNLPVSNNSLTTVLPKRSHCCPPPESCISTVEDSLMSSNQLQENYRPSPVYSPHHETSKSITMPTSVETSRPGHVFSTPVHLHYGNSEKQCHSEPIATVSTPPSCNSVTNGVKVWNSRAQLANNNNISSYASKQRVNRSLSYSEGNSLYLPDEHDISNISTSNNMPHDKQKKNTSNDGFNMPVKMLLEDLPMPSTLPHHLTFSPSKPLHETSFSEVKQFLKTPQKLRESHQIATEVTPQKSSLQFDSQFLKTPEKPVKSNVTSDVTDTAGFGDRVEEVIAMNADEGGFLDAGSSPGTVIFDRSSPIKGQATPAPAPSNSIDNSVVSNSPSHTFKPVQNIVVNSNQNSPNLNFDVNDNRQSVLLTPTNNSDKKSAKPHKQSSATSKKKKFKQKQRKKKEVFDYAERLKQRAFDFADIYFNRVRKTLVDVPELCLQFFALMESVTTCQLTKLQTYYKVAELFSDYPELVDSFSGFLEQHEARHVGKYIEWLMYDLVIQFHLSCEEYFFNVPGHYDKITTKIIEVTSYTKKSKQIVNEVVPLFQGNTSLTNKFIRLFPDLSPPPCDDDDFEVIDFAAVSAGLKEIDDFEEIAYQPPELGDLSEDDQTHRKRTDSASSMTRKDPNPNNNNNSGKYLNKKSNANITASKLKQLASKRKNKPNQRKRADAKKRHRVSSDSGGMVLVATSVDEDTGFEDEMIAMHALNTSKESNPHTSFDEISNMEKASGNEVFHPRKTSADKTFHPVKTLNNEICQLEKTTDVKLDFSSHEIDIRIPASNELFITDQSNQSAVTRLKTNNEPYVSKTSRDHISNANDTSNSSIKSEDNIFHIIKRDIPSDYSYIKEQSGNESKHLSVSDLTFPDGSLSNHDQSSKVVEVESTGMSVTSSSTDQTFAGDVAVDCAIEKDSVVQHDSSPNDVVSSSKKSPIDTTILDNLVSTGDKKPTIAKTDEKENPVEVDFTVISSTTKPQELNVIEISSDSHSVILEPIDRSLLDHNDATINFSSDKKSQASVVKVQQRAPDKESSSELDSEVEIIMSKSRTIPGLQFSTPKPKKPSSTNVDDSVWHGEDAQFNLNLSKTDDTDSSKTSFIPHVIKSESSSSHTAQHYNISAVSQGLGLNHFSLAHELTFPEYPADSSTRLDKKSTLASSPGKYTNATSTSCERHLSFSELIKKPNPSSWDADHDNDGDDDDTVSSTEKLEYDVFQKNEIIVKTAESKHVEDESTEEHPLNLFENVTQSFALKSIDKELQVQVEPIDLSKTSLTHTRASSFVAQRNCYSACTERSTTPTERILTPRSLNSDTKMKCKTFEPFKDPSTRTVNQNDGRPFSAEKLHVLRTSAEILKDSSTHAHKLKRNRPSRRLTGKSKYITMIASAEELADKSDFFSGDSMDSTRSDVSLLDMMSPRHPSCTNNMNTTNTAKKTKRAKVTTIELSEQCENEALSFENSPVDSSTLQPDEYGCKPTSFSEETISMSLSSTSPVVTMMKDETSLLTNTSSSTNTKDSPKSSNSESTLTSLLTTRSVVTMAKSKISLLTNTSSSTDIKHSPKSSNSESTLTSSLTTRPVVTKAKSKISLLTNTSSSTDIKHSPKSSNSESTLTSSLTTRPVITKETSKISPFTNTSSSTDTKDSPKSSNSESTLTSLLTTRSVVTMAKSKISLLTNTSSSTDIKHSPKSSNSESTLTSSLTTRPVVTKAKSKISLLTNTLSSTDIKHSPKSSNSESTLKPSLTTRPVVTKATSKISLLTNTLSSTDIKHSPKSSNSESTLTSSLTTRPVVTKETSKILPFTNTSSSTDTKDSPKSSNSESTLTSLLTTRSVVTMAKSKISLLTNTSSSTDIKHSPKSSNSESTLTSSLTTRPVVTKAKSKISLLTNTSSSTDIKHSPKSSNSESTLTSSLTTRPVVTKATSKISLLTNTLSSTDIKHSPKSSNSESTLTSSLTTRPVVTKETSKISPFTNTSSSTDTKDSPKSSNSESTLTSLLTTRSVVTMAKSKISLLTNTLSSTDIKHSPKSSNSESTLTSSLTTRPVVTKATSKISLLTNTLSSTDIKHSPKSSNSESTLTSSLTTRPVVTKETSKISPFTNTSSSTGTKQSSLCQVERQTSSIYIERETNSGLKLVHEPLLTKIVERPRDEEASPTSTGKTHVKKLFPLMSDMEKAGNDTNSIILKTEVKTEENTVETGMQALDGNINNYLSNATDAPLHLHAATSEATTTVSLEHEVKDSVSKALVTDKTTDETRDDDHKPSLTLPHDIPWKKAEDEIILFTVVKQGDDEETLKTIAQQLKTRTALQVKDRLQFLMKQIDTSSSSSSDEGGSESDSEDSADDL